MNNNMYDNIAKKYDGLFSKKNEDYLKDVKEIINLYNYQLTKEDWVLDFGSGTGGHAEKLLERTNCNLVCYDISNKMLEQAKIKLEPRFKGRVHYINELSSLFNYKFKVIYSMFFVINHIIEYDDLINALDTIRKCRCKDSIICMDLFNDELVKKNPPKPYVRFSKDLIKKTLAIKEVKDHFIFIYKNYNIDCNLMSELTIKIRSWSIKLISEHLKIDNPSIMDLSFKKTNTPGYQFILYSK